MLATIASAYFFLARKLDKQKVFVPDDEKSSASAQRQTHTSEKSQDAATSTEDGLTNTVHISKIETSCYVTEEGGKFHAHEAAGCHHEGDLHQVLARVAIHIMGPFQGQNCIIKDKFISRYK
jgi:hypothetical protein